MVDELKPAYVPPRRKGTTPAGYSTAGSIAGTVFSPGSGLMDPDAVRGNSVAMATGRGGLGDAPWNFAEYMENFIANFGYNPFVGTGIGPSEGDIPNVAMAPELGDDGYPVDIDPILKQFLVMFSKYIEGQDTDDIDRVFLQQEANEWIDLYNKYLNDEITLDELKAFEPDYLAEIDGWNDYYAGIVGGTGEGTEGEGDPSTISDEDAIASVLASVPDKLKGLITEDNIIEVLKTLGGIEDPMTAIKRGMIAGIEIEFPKDWRDWKVFGTIRIPGVPLPPGIIDVTLGDIEEAVSNVGGTITDFIEGIEDGSSWEKVKDWVRGVWDGVTDEDEWGKTIGGFEGYIKGILGDLVGGYIITDIYDEIKGWFEPEAPPPPPGGDDDEDDGEDGEETPKQGDDIADFDYDSDLEGDTALDWGGFDDDDDDDDTTGGLDDIEIGDPEPIDYDPQIPGDGDDDDDEITLGDPEDDDEEELGGGGGSFGAGGGGSGLFEGGIRGLSYSPQPIPTVKPPEYVDAMASIGGLIANLSSKNGRNA